MIYLLRHGDAEEGDGDDARRRLTEKGERQAMPRAGRWRAGGEIDACLDQSPKVRAAETARIAAEALGLEVETPRSCAAARLTRWGWPPAAATSSWSATSPTSPTRWPGSPAPT